MTAPLTSLLAAVDPDDHPGRIIDRVMHAAREHLNLDVSFVTEFTGGQRVFRYANGNLERFEVQVEGAEPLAGTYCQRVVDGTLGALVSSASQHPITSQMEVTRRLGVEVYVGVPVQFSDGRLYGTLCCLSGEGNGRITEQDVLFIRLAAAIVAEQLERDEIATIQRRAALERIRNVLAGGIEIVYQPIVSLAANEVLGFEALSRFSAEPHRGPQAWFEEAWAVGMGPELELAAVRKAVEGLALIPDGAYLSVNVSPETLLAGELQEILGTDFAYRIVLEITEHARVFDYEPVTSALATLREAGFRVAVDDLGTGHAGINHLLRFQPDVFKIDLSVVQGVRRDPLRRAIAATFATLAANIGASVVAEGIETMEDRDALEILGLTAGQGFHIAHPLTADEIAGFVPARA